MDEPTPQQWIHEAWHKSRLELFVPVAAGLAVAQFLTALFALRSSHHLLLLLCLAIAGFAMVRTLAFLYQLSRDRKAGVETYLYARGIGELFVPLLLSAALYGAIAPNYWLTFFFVLSLLPHVVFLWYVAKRYTRMPANILTNFSLPVLSFEAVGVRILRVIALVRAFIKTPYLKQP